MDVVFVVAAHKPGDLPRGPGYLPVHVGSAVSEHKLDIQCDDTGDNISSLNPSFCELTATYWAWKNLDADAVGLNHYRRYFRGAAKHMDFHGHSIMSTGQAAHLLEKHDVILAKPRRYWIETVETHYNNAHNPADLRLLRDIIAQQCPRYLHALDSVLTRRSLSLYNMHLMRRSTFHSYCEWLFPILFTAESRIDPESYDPYQRRVIGYLAERLLNVWVEHHSNTLNISTARVVNIDGENIPKKTLGLLKRKFNSAVAGPNHTLIGRDRD